MSEKKTVYVAGKMRGVPHYAFPAFDKARDRLIKLRFTVLSPADMDWETLPLGFDLAAAIERDNKAIDMSDGIYVIHEGIGSSAGGIAEIERGMAKGKVIVYDTMDDEAILKAMGAGEQPRQSLSQWLATHATPIPLTYEEINKRRREEDDGRNSNLFVNGSGTVHVKGRHPDVDWSALDKDYEEARVKMKNQMGAKPRYTEREGVLDEAKKLITGDRNNSYGPPTQDFQRTADMMTALFSAKMKEGERFKPSDVAWIITLVKASRAQHSAKRDNYVDAAGYMGCGWECEAENLKRETPGV